MAVAKQMLFAQVVIVAGANDGFGTVDVGGGALQVTLASGSYDTPAALAAAFETAFDVHGAFTCAISTTTGKLTVSRVGNFTMDLTSGSTGAVTLSGFVAGVFSGAATYTANGGQVPGLWLPAPAVAFDLGEQSEEPHTVVQVAVSGRGKTVEEGRLFVRPLRFEFLTAAETFIAREAAAPNANTAGERLWRAGRAKLAYYRDRTGALTGYYYLDGDTVAAYKPELMPFQKELYAVDLKLRKFI